MSRSNSVFGSGDDSVNGSGEILRGKHCVLPDDFLQVSHTTAACKVVDSSYLFFSCINCFLVVLSHFSVYLEYNTVLTLQRVVINPLAILFVVAVRTSFIIQIFKRRPSHI